MSEWAVEAIKKRLDGQVVPEQIKLPVTLIERRST
jgi:DNA-binding LacI/PurR family transcriptional regulator